MAKALLGHTGSADPRVTARLVAENRLLHQRVADLEAHVLRLESENDLLAAAAGNLAEHERLLREESMLPA